MTIKNKIRSGVIFLIIITLIIGGLGAYFMRRLADESGEIIKDNYISVEYAAQMTNALDKIHNGYINSIIDYSPDTVFTANSELTSLIRLFNENIGSEINNITESGEKELAVSIRSNFDHYIALIRRASARNPRQAPIRFAESALLYGQLREQLRLLSDMNMQAIIRKNDRAQNTARDISISIFIIGLLYLALAVVFLIRFPSFIADPIKKLTRSISIIADKNYSERLDFQTKDEFGELSRSFNTMAARLQEYESSNLANVLFEKKRIETIIRNMKDGILVLDEHQHILFANPTFCRFLGLSEKDLITKSIDHVIGISEPVKNTLQEICTKPISDFNQKPFQINMEGMDNYFTKEIFDVIMSDPLNQKNQPLGQVIVMKNITHFRELDLAKTNFLATISHELKTPLSAVDFSLKLLQDARIGALNEEQTRLLRTIKNENTRLIKLVSELLDMSQLESGHIVMHIEKVTAYEIILLATDALEFQLSQKKIHLRTEIPDTLPFIRADLDKTVWVMINLLTNAIRYTPENATITISVTLEDRSIRFMTEDSGGGIEPQYLDKIFDKYMRLPSVEGEEKTGTGIGLSTAKEFIIAQGGKIWAESETGKGSRFYFTLPKFSS